MFSGGQIMEKLVIDRTPALNTPESIEKDLCNLGVMPGMVIIVHSSLSSLGWVVGGPISVIYALIKVLTPDGTLIMPAHSGDYSDPSAWCNPPVPSEWWDDIRKFMPAFDPKITPTRGIGVVAETFRNWPDVLRSYHPALSFCAWGKHARVITQNHSLDFSLGDNSPLRRIYELNGHVLLLGVDYSSNTSFHLSEYKKPDAEVIENGAPIIEDGHRIWKKYKEINFDTDRFQELGLEFERVCEVKKGMVGIAESRLFSQREAVDFAVNKLTGSGKI